MTSVDCSSGTKFTVNGLKPFTVYAFQIQVQQYEALIIMFSKL